MNTKHLACVLLFAVIIGLFLGTKVLNEKMVTATEAAEDAKARHQSTQSKHTMARAALEKARTDTAAHRMFLDRWRQNFESNGSEAIAVKNDFGRMLKRFPNLTPFGNQTNPPVENKDMSYVNRRVTSTVKLEGDAEKAIQLLASIERELPTSRISSLEIRKGQRNNDIELDLSVEFPLVAAPLAAK
jgi:hypothetical protein